LNKDNSPTTSACDDFSINVPTPNILLSSSIESPNLAIDPTTYIAQAWTVGFNTSNIIIRRGIISLASYFATKRIQAPCPT
jgi:hypothetical protein